MSNFEDISLTCKDCNSAFIYTAKDQAFFAQQGFSPPKRCRACRQKKKEQQNGNAAPQQPSHQQSQFRGSSNVMANVEVVRRPLKGGKGKSRRDDDYDDGSDY